MLCACVMRGGREGREGERKTETEKENRERKSRNEGVRRQGEKTAGKGWG